MTTQEAAALLGQMDRVLILTHRRPDGDTVGCAAGLCAALRQLGRTAYLLRNPDITEANAVYAAPYWGPEDFVPDHVVSVDIAARSLFFPAAEAYFDRIDLAIDHHPSFEGFGQGQLRGRLPGRLRGDRLRDLPGAGSGDAGGRPAALRRRGHGYGCFVYANTTANTHAVAAALMATGIDYFAVNKRHFRTKSRKRIALEADILSRMEFFHQGRGVFLTVPLSLMERVGAAEDDAEDLSTLAGMVEGVDCGALLRELKPGEWKLSLRTGANGRVNATEACRLLGGGGHAMAAGATVRGDLDQVKAQILAAVDAVKRA